MEIKPQKSYKTPAYPEKYMVLDNPDILSRLPQRWMGNATVGIALSSVIMLMLAGCGQKTGGSGALETENSGKGTGISNANAVVQAAPIFEHGEGRGSFGCVSVAPPAFLSEAEAFEVIAEEAKREGIIFTKGGLTMDGVEMPLTSLVYNSEDKEQAGLKTKKGSLDLDGYDVNKKIAYEYISVDDIIEWQNNEGARSTVESYDAIGTAQRLKLGLDGRSGDSTTAVFYDPMGFNKEVHDKYSKEFREISENEKLTDDERQKKWEEINQKYEDEIKEIQTGLLREQVKDFLGWLKAQGII